MPKKVRFDSKVQIRKIPPLDLVDANCHKDCKITQTINQMLCTKSCSTSEFRVLPLIPFSSVSSSYCRERMQLSPPKMPLQFLTLPLATDDRWQPNSSSFSLGSTSPLAPRRPPIPQQRKPFIEHLDSVHTPLVPGRHHEQTSPEGVRNAAFEPKGSLVPHALPPSRKDTTSEPIDKSKLVRRTGSLPALPTTNSVASKRTRRMQQSLSMPAIFCRMGPFGSISVTTQGHQNALFLPENDSGIVTRSSSIPMYRPKLCAPSDSTSSSNHPKCSQTSAANTTTLGFSAAQNCPQPRAGISMVHYVSKAKKTCRPRYLGDSPPVIPIRKAFYGNELVL
eukprot:jgi/Psemu1/315983/fgenesh1_kg.2628_\